MRHQRGQNVRIEEVGNPVESDPGWGGNRSSPAKKVEKRPSSRLFSEAEAFNGSLKGGKGLKTRMYRI